MLPHFNSQLYSNNNNNQLPINGANPPNPQQVMGNNPGNFAPSNMQIRPQFQMGMLNNVRFPVPQLTNPNSYFAPNQFSPFPQGSLHNLGVNSLPQMFAPNGVNLPQFLPNGQFNGLPNLVQNITQLLQMQMANCANQNPGMFANAQPSVPNGNGVVQQPVPNAGVATDFGSPQGKRNQNRFSGAANSKGNGGVVNGVKDGKNGWRKPHDKNFNRNLKHDASQRGSGKMQFHHRQNAQGNFKYEKRGKGNFNMLAKNSSPCEETQLGKKRSLTLNYSEQEIQQWRAERRKNYPSNTNMKKKLKQNTTGSEVTDEVVKLRRQQLKEILAKQAELGCEVAEIPSSYLSDSEQQSNGRQQNNKVFGKRERFHNKFDKRGKFHQNNRFPQRRRPMNNDSVNLQERSDHFNKKQRLSNGSSANLHAHNKKEPSLLKKLLSSDIKRDKKYLLQVFRFMVMNSFFENPENPLKYPVVIVKEPGDEGDVTEDKLEIVKDDDYCDGKANAVDEDEGERTKEEDGEILE